MRCFVMFVTAVCALFLLKLKWPKNKSFYDSGNASYSTGKYSTNAFLTFYGIRVFQGSLRINIFFKVFEISFEDTMAL